jgi:tRNA-Thr(GGU) m(6)t(6)A37 methyltransferase TsaA
LRPVTQSLLVDPIGVIHTPFADRASAPRQPGVGDAAPGTIELYRGHNYHHALEDLESWRYIWVIFWFHLNQGWRPKVRPPRSGSKKGLFATRSPHRPNPIGLSVVELLKVEGHTLHVKGVDMVDGSPVLDLKPYVPYADAIAGNSGWLGPIPAENPVADPGVQFEITWSEQAMAQIAWLEKSAGLLLQAPISARLSLGPGHHYRRTWQEGQDLIMAYRSWRVRCAVQDRTLQVIAITSGYRESDLLNGPSSLPRWPEDAIELHVAYTAWLKTGA